MQLEIDCNTIKASIDRGDDFLLLDCREQSEYAVARIDSCVLLPMSELPARFEELASHRQRHIVVYCHRGGRSLQVASWLREQGFTSVQSMAGGIERWSLEIDSSIARY